MVRPPPQNAVEPLAALGREDLARIRRRDGREVVRPEDAEAHQGIAKCLRERLDRVGPPDLVVAESAPRALRRIGQVVDREHRGDVAEERVLAAFGREPPGGGSRVRVVRVDHVGLP